MKRTHAEIDQDFEDILDIRLKARSHNDLETIEKTQKDWEKIKNEWLQSVYTRNEVVPEDEKEFIKKSFKGIGKEDRRIH